MCHWRQTTRFAIFNLEQSTYVVPFEKAELGYKCLEAAPTLKYKLLNICIIVCSV